jgi:hypothetical protein
MKILSEILLYYTKNNEILNFYNFKFVIIGRKFYTLLNERKYILCYEKVVLYLFNNKDM